MSLHVCISNLVKESNFYTAVRFYRKGHCVVGEWSFYVYGFRLCLKFVYLSVYVCMVVFVCTVCATLSYVFCAGCVNLKRRKSGSTKRTFPFLTRMLSFDVDIMRKEISNNINGIYIKKDPVYNFFTSYGIPLHIIL